MTYIDDVIAKLDTLTDKQRATWHANAIRVIARGPSRNAAYATALQPHCGCATRLPRSRQPARMRMH